MAVEKISHVNPAAGQFIDPVCGMEGRSGHLEAPLRL